MHSFNLMLIARPSFIIPKTASILRKIASRTGVNCCMAQTHNDDFVKLLVEHDPAIRAFVRAMIPDATDVAEVMQNVSVVAWKKFSTLENPESDFGKWACVIARYEILKFRRSKAKDRLLLDADLIERIADEGIEETSQRQGWILAL